VIDEYRPSKFLEYIDLIFSEQFHFSNKRTHSMSEEEVVEFIGNMAESAGIISYESFRSAIKHNIMDDEQRIEWKYGISRGITSTPTFMINGWIVKEAESDWTLKRWKQLIKKLEPQILTENEVEAELIMPIPISIHDKEDNR